MSVVDAPGFMKVLKAKDLALEHEWGKGAEFVVNIWGHKKCRAVLRAFAHLRDPTGELNLNTTPRKATLRAYVDVGRGEVSMPVAGVRDACARPKGFVACTVDDSPDFLHDCTVRLRCQAGAARASNHTPARTRKGIQ